MKLFRYPVDFAKWFLKPSSSIYLLLFTTIVLAKAIIQADVSVGSLSTHTIWDSVDFWRRLQMSAYLSAMVWACFSLIAYPSARAIYFVSLILDFFLPEALLRDSAHQAFIYLDIYKLFGYKNGASTNPNVAWIVLLFLLSFVLLIRLLIKSKGAFNHFAKIRSVFFPFVGITSVLALTLIMHETIIGGMLTETKSVCASDAEAIQKEEEIFNASCLYRDDNCAKVIIGDQGTPQINVLHTPQRAMVLETNDPSGDHPADKNEKAIQELFVSEGKIVLSRAPIYNWSVNGFDVYSACAIKLDAKTALISIDTHEFSLRFSQAQMRFHRLVSISSWVWIFSLMLHLLRLSGLARKY